MYSNLLNILKTDTCIYMYINMITGIKEKSKLMLSAQNLKEYHI